MREDGEQLGRFKVRSLMRELDLVSKQIEPRVRRSSA
jgi:putative transposase